MLQKSGVKFNYLGAEEPYPGMFLHELGYAKEFKEYAETVYNLLIDGSESPCPINTSIFFLSFLP